MWEKQLKAIVLAAGKGTRMAVDGEDAPKVMRTAMGRPLLYHVLSALSFIPREDTILVVGYKKEQVTAAFPECRFAEQDRQLGTGHAVLCAMGALEGYSGSVMVCCGDMPLIREETYRALCRQHFDRGGACTILTGPTDIPLPYGRIVRDEGGAFLRVVEDKDCTPQQRQIDELNSGVYVFDADALRRVLPMLGRSNAQGEYYLTDVPEHMLALGLQVDICRRELGMEIIGVNTPEQLRQVEDILASR